MSEPEKEKLFSVFGSSADPWVECASSDPWITFKLLDMEAFTWTGMYLTIYLRSGRKINVTQTETDTMYYELQELAEQLEGIR